MTIIKYLKSRIWTIAAFLISAAVVFLCLALYGVDLRLLIYPFALCGLIGAAFLTAGYFRAKKTCQGP